MLVVVKVLLVLIDWNWRILIGFNAVDEDVCLITIGFVLVLCVVVVVVIIVLLLPESLPEIPQIDFKFWSW